MSLLINNTNGASAPYIGKTLVSGNPNIRAAHSIAGRLRFTGTTNITQYIIGFGANADQSGTYLNRTTSDGASNLFGRRYNSTLTTADSATFTGAYSGTSAWHHYAVTYDATNIRIYLDGVLTATTASATTRTSSTTSCNYFCSLGGTYVLADVCFFGRALSADECLFLSAGRLAPVLSVSDCFGFFPLHFDNYLKDYSGRGNDMSTIAGTGTAPAVNNEGVPIPWTRHSPRLILPAVVLFDLGAGSSRTRAISQNISESKLADLTQNANKTRAISQNITESKTGALTQLANLTRSISQNISESKTGALTQTANKTRALWQNATESKSAAVAGTLLTRSINSSTEAKLAGLTQLANKTRAIASTTGSLTGALVQLANKTRSINPALTESKAAAVAGASLTRAINTATESKSAALTQGAMLTISHNTAVFDAGDLGAGSSRTRSINAAVETKGVALTQTANKTRAIWSATISGSSGSTLVGDDNGVVSRRMLVLETRRRIR